MSLHAVTFEEAKNFGVSNDPIDTIQEITPMIAPRRQKMGELRHFQPSLEHNPLVYFVELILTT